VTRLRLVFLPDVKEDLERLSEDESERRVLQRRALELAVQAARQEIEGRPCAGRPSTGNLTDCRKLYFDTAQDVPPRYRLIYRLTPDEQEPTAVEILAVGLKTEHRNISNEYIYSVVGRRLGRL
jgi:hypothetical protein